MLAFEDSIWGCEGFGIVAMQVHGKKPMRITASRDSKWPGCQSGSRCGFFLHAFSVHVGMARLPEEPT